MRKLINTLTMTAVIFMLSTAVPAAIPASVPAAAPSSSLVKPWTNGRLMVTANHRYLQFENGQPFFLLGDTGWLLPEHLDRSEAQYYLQKCRAAGFNTVLVQVMNGTPAYNI